MTRRKVFVARRLEGKEVVGAWWQSGAPLAGSALAGETETSIAIEEVPEAVVAAAGGPIAFVTAAPRSQALLLEDVGLVGVREMAKAVEKVEVGAAGGVAPLAQDKLVPDANLPIFLLRSAAALEANDDYTGAGATLVKSWSLDANWLPPSGWLQVELLSTRQSGSGGYVARWKVGGQFTTAHATMTQARQRHTLILWARSSSSAQTARSIREATLNSDQLEDALTVDLSSIQTIALEIDLDTDSDTWRFYGLRAFGVRGTAPA